MGRNNRNKRAPKQPPSSATTKNVKGAHKSDPATSKSPVTTTGDQVAATASQLISEKNKVELISKDYQETLEGDLSCAICQDIYINPLMLNCSHSFCKFCVVRWLSKQIGCPQCRMKVTFQGDNLALRNIINKMVQKSTQDFRDNRTKNVNQRLIDEAQQDREGLLLSISKRQDSRPRTPRYRFVQSTEGEGRALNDDDDDHDEEDENQDEEDDASIDSDDDFVFEPTIPLDESSNDTVNTVDLIEESISELATMFYPDHPMSQQSRSRSVEANSSSAIVPANYHRVSSRVGPPGLRRRAVTAEEYILSQAEEDNEEEEEEEQEVEDDDDYDDSDSDSDDDNDEDDDDDDENQEEEEEEEEADSYDDGDEDDDEDFAPQDPDNDDTSESESEEGNGNGSGSGESSSGSSLVNQSRGQFLLHHSSEESDTDFLDVLQHIRPAHFDDEEPREVGVRESPARSNESSIYCWSSDDERRDNARPPQFYRWDILPRNPRRAVDDTSLSTYESPIIPPSPYSWSSSDSSSDTDQRYSAESTVEYRISSSDDEDPHHW